MITNLVFSRVTKSEGIEKTELKIIEVNVPEISSSDGWKLLMNADKVTEIPYITGRCKLATADPKEDSETNLLMNVAGGDPINYPEYENAICINANTANSVSIKKEEVEAKKEPNIREFPSCIPGTACLIRANNELRIAYRSGKNANITTPNRVCISDADKQNFFNAVRVENPGITNIKKWVLKPGGCRSLFDHWNAYFDEEYLRQLDYYKHSQKKENNA